MVSATTDIRATDYSFYRPEPAVSFITGSERQAFVCGLGNRYATYQMKFHL